MDLIVNTFQSGELSPEMDARTDLPEYYQGARLAENFIVKPTGGMTLRQGFEHIAAAYSHSYQSRLVGFVKGTDKYTLEFSHLKMRVFKDGAIVLGGGGVPYELTTPWTAVQVQQLVFATKGQAIFHPDLVPYELTCTSDASWTLTAFDSEYGPFLDENDVATLTIDPSATTGNITLTASAALFDAGHVGSIWMLTHDAAALSVTGTFSSVSTSTTVTRQGIWTVFLWNTANEFYGTVRLQKSMDSGSTWLDVQVWDWSGGANIGYQSLKGEETEIGVQYRLNCTQWAYGACYYTLSFAMVKQQGIVEITAVTNSMLAAATVLVTLGGTYATSKWREGAWSTYQGFPQLGCVHESRIYAARTERKPTGIWAGKPFLRRKNGRLMDSGTTYEASDAFSRVLDIDECNAIEWLASLWVLLVGGDGSVSKVIGASEYQPVTGADFQAMPQAGLGSAAVQPVKLSGFLVYTARNARRVYEMTYSDDARVYAPEDLTFLADHIAGDGIAGWAFQQQPYPILWAYTTGGELIALTRDREKQIKGWHRHPMADAVVEGLAVIPGTTEDEVWITVRRTVNSSTYRSIERLKSFGHWTDQRDCFFVDSGTTWDGGAAKTITGIAIDAVTNRVTVTAAAHGFSNDWTVKLSGVVGMTDVNGKVYTVADKTADAFVLKTREGSGYIDGSLFTNQTYTSGGTAERVANSVSGLTQLAGEDDMAVLLDGQPATGDVTAAGVYTIGAKDRHYHNTIAIGRPIVGKLSPMRPEVRTADGTVQGQKKRIVSCGVRLYQSAGGKIGTSADDVVKIVYDEAGDEIEQPYAIIDGDKIQDGPGGWDENGDIHIETDCPLPMTVTAILFGLEA